MKLKYAIDGYVETLYKSQLSNIPCGQPLNPSGDRIYHITIPYHIIPVRIVEAVGQRVCVLSTEGSELECYKYMRWI